MLLRLGAALTVLSAPSTLLAAPCTEAISPTNAQKLFDSLKDFRGDDGCVLDTVKTDRDVMQVVWTKNSALQPAAVVQPRSCAPAGAVVGPALALTVPEATAAACTAAVTKLTALIGAETFGGVVRSDAPPVAPPPARTRRRWPAAIVVAALIAVVSGAIVLRGRTRR